MDSTARPASPSLTIIATLGVIAALYLLKPILIPISVSILLACLLSPATHLLRRLLPVGPFGAAVILFLLLALAGLYAASLTAESLVQAARTFPSDVERLASRLSERVNDAVRDHPYLANILPEPGTIDILGYTNRELLLNTLNYRLTDLTAWVGHGVVVLFLVLFLLAEAELIVPRVVHLITVEAGESMALERTLKNVTRKVRAYLLARTVLNIGLGAATAVALMLLGIDFAVPLGVFAGVTNYIPYIGNVAGGSLAVLVTLGQRGSIADGLIVASVFLAIVTVEGYLVMPYVMGRSLDLNGTTVLIACLFWGFLWGLMGLILAIPITVSIKLVLQHLPASRHWADLMSRARPAPQPEEKPEPAIEPATEPGPDPEPKRNRRRLLARRLGRG
ncbi:AI-2E family transporter [Tautonia sociabilis]|uniref:AI-2E family transporter n=1 Tax=Tautonia sociabilis TaxID=2080755 RepID=A0A432MLG0_9BACT|nr:AI-2E family transporter [Tautonia sociabilis]RUL88099.1 AI-2E family transporter [Tautonia sociabilis]